MNKKLAKEVHHKAIQITMSFIMPGFTMKDWSKSNEFKLIYRAVKTGMKVGHATGFQKAIKVVHERLISNNVLDGANVVEVDFQSALYPEDDYENSNDLTSPNDL